MGLKEDYRLKKLIKEMHKLHCKITKCCDGEGGDGLSCDDLENCQTIIDIKQSISDIKSFDCDDLENCQEIIDIKDSIPTDISDLTDEEELLFSGDYNDLDNKPTIPTNNSELVNDSGYLACEDLENCQEIIDIKDSIPTDISDLTDEEELLFSGDYNDLTNKPTFKTVDGQSIIGTGDISVGDNNVQSDWNEADSSSDAFIKNKPSIPIVNDGQLELNTSGIATGGVQNFSANQAGNTTFTVHVPGTDITLTFNNNILTVSSSTGQSDSVDLSSLVTDNTYVTSMSLSGNTLILTNNDNTTVQQDLSSILFDGDYNNLINKPTIPTNTSELVNDSGYLACEDLEKCQEIIDIKDSIPTIFIERSLRDLQEDIANNALVPGATYKITGVHRAHTVDGIPIRALYDDGRDLGTTIFLKAISENELETFGSGIFYNPKYDKEVQGFGIWSSDKTYNVDDIVFWGGYAWKNLTGNTGSDTDILNLDGEWEKRSYVDDKVYNKVVDYIEYDIENDIITRRYDTVNEIDVSSGFYDIVVLYMQMGVDYSSISLMQWGNDLVFDLSAMGQVGVGKISVKHMSIAELINFKGAYISNLTLDNRSYLSNVAFDNGSYLRYVTLNNGSYLNNVTFDNQSSLENATFDNESSLYNVTFDNVSSLNRVTIDNGLLFKVTFDRGSHLTSVTFNTGSYLTSVTLDNNSRLQNVTFDNGSRLQNVTFENSIMTNSTFVSFIANFSNQTYNNLNLSNIKFEGTGGTVYAVPDISMATIITDPDIPQKKVFGINSSTIKIQFWDVGLNDFNVRDITD